MIIVILIIFILTNNIIHDTNHDDDYYQYHPYYYRSIMYSFMNMTSGRLPARPRGSHSSNATCPTRGFFERGE